MEKYVEEGRSIKIHKDLRVWQESINLVKLIYRLAQNFP